MLQCSLSIYILLSKLLAGYRAQLILYSFVSIILLCLQPSDSWFEYWNPHELKNKF